MSTGAEDLAQDPELQAMVRVFAALKDLDSDAQNRVLEYVERRLGLNRIAAKHGAEISGTEVPAPDRTATEEEQRGTTRSSAEADRQGDEEEADAGELEGISPVARKWMRRNGLSAARMSELFSLGIEDIDLVATRVPGESARERMHNVMLLQGIASYLSGGVPRIDSERLREAMRHYDADVGGNFNRDVRLWAAEITGTRAAGDLTLTTRGLNAAKDLIKEMTQDES